MTRGRTHAPRARAATRLRRRDALALLSAPLLGACARRAAAPGPRRPHIVILVVDALRQDFVGCYGGEGGATAAIDRIAAEGVRFANAYANAPWTLPSHASLFTGLPPEAHRQTHAAVEDTDGRIGIAASARFPGRCATMASALKELGYQTVGISQNPWVGALSSQDHGFDYFWELGRTSGLPFPEQQGDDLRFHRVTYFLRKFLELRRAPERPREAKERLETRLRALLADVEMDPVRVAQEVALMADRLDFTEECVRLAAHLDQFQTLITGPEQAGRKLNFLLQEMNREANTIGSKANDVEVAHAVIVMKEEIERLREQVQNVE